MDDSVNDSDDSVTMENRRVDGSLNAALTGLAGQGDDSFGSKAVLSIEPNIARLLRWETNLYSPAGRAALAYAEALTRTPDATSVAPFQDAHDAVAQWYSKEQILDIAGVVINMNIWTRLKLAEGSAPSGRPNP